MANEYIEREGGLDGFFVKKFDVGLIAQDVQKVLPEIVVEKSDGYLGIKYDRVIALVLEALKELALEVEEIKKKVI